MIEEDKLRKAIADAATNGKVPCKALLLIAESLDVPPDRVGNTCDEMKVRVSACQLGCFGSRS